MIRRRGIALGIVATLALQVAFPALHVLTHHGEDGHGESASVHCCSCHQHAAVPPRSNAGKTVVSSHKECAICAALKAPRPLSVLARSAVAAHATRAWAQFTAPRILVRASLRDHSHAARAPPAA